MIKDLFIEHPQFCLSESFINATNVVISQNKFLLRNPKEILPGYYLEVNLSGEAIFKNLFKALKYFNKEDSLEVTIYG